MLAEKAVQCVKNMALVAKSWEKPWEQDKKHTGIAQLSLHNESTEPTDVRHRRKSSRNGFRVYWFTLSDY